MESGVAETVGRDLAVSTQQSITGKPLTWHNRYVLWKDEDNKKLVELHYPEYLETYESLPREIYRADMASVFIHLSMPSSIEVIYSTDTKSRFEICTCTISEVSTLTWT